MIIIISGAGAAAGAGAGGEAEEEDLFNGKSDERGGRWARPRNACIGRHDDDEEEGKGLGIDTLILLPRKSLHRLCVCARACVCGVVRVYVCVPT